MTKLNGWTGACAALLFCAATAIAMSAQTFTTVLSFDGSNEGSNPTVLIQGLDGNLYGATHGHGFLYERKRQPWQGWRAGRFSSRTSIYAVISEKTLVTSIYHQPLQYNRKFAKSVRSSSQRSNNPARMKATLWQVRV
jgi:hypothetical protein